MEKWKTQNENGYIEERWTILKRRAENTKMESGKSKKSRWKIQKVKVENAKLEILKVGAHAAESE